MTEIATHAARLHPWPACRFGLISLASDWTSSDEIRAICAGPDRAIKETRIANDDVVSTESLSAMEARLPEAASRLPGGASYAAIGYLCTSASMLFGDARVETLVQQAVPGAPVTNPMRAAVAAAKALGLRRIGLVTPYVPDVTAGIADRFREAGIHVPYTVTFDEPSDARVARISAASLAEAAERVSARADGVFISCTALRTVWHTSDLEARLGLPVLSSNAAVAWHLLRLAGVSPAAGAWGRLLDGAHPAITR